MNAKLQIIQRDGKPEWAVIPYDEYERLSALAENYEDIQAFDEAMRELEEGEELVPATVVDRLMEGESPLKVWREHRGFTLMQMADQANTDESTLFRIEESGEKLPFDLQTHLAAILNIDTDDLSI